MYLPEGYFWSPVRGIFGVGGGIFGVLVELVFRRGGIEVFACKEVVI